MAPRVEVMLIVAAEPLDLKSSIDELFLQVKQQPKQLRKGGLSPRQLRVVLDYLFANFERNIGMEHLAEMCGLSRAQFFRGFKHSVGVSPYRYLTDLRLRTAKQLLVRRTLSCREVATAVGMPSQAGFSALFRRRFGTTPRFYAMSFQQVSRRKLRTSPGKN